MAAGCPGEQIYSTATDTPERGKRGRSGGPTKCYIGRGCVGWYSPGRKCDMRSVIRGNAPKGCGLPLTPVRGRAGVSPRQHIPDEADPLHHGTAQPPSSRRGWPQHPRLPAAVVCPPPYCLDVEVALVPPVGMSQWTNAMVPLAINVIAPGNPAGRTMSGGMQIVLLPNSAFTCTL